MATIVALLSEVDSSVLLEGRGVSSDRIFLAKGGGDCITYDEGWGISISSELVRGLVY